MEQFEVLHKRKLTWGLLFIGFCCVFGWLATNVILLTKFTNWRHFADIAALSGTLLMSLICTSFYAVAAVIALRWGVGRFKRTDRKKYLIPSSLISAALLTPVLGIAGITVILVTPFAFAHIRAFAFGPNIVQTADSPDGAYQAYIIDKPSLDGPNHHLYVKKLAAGESSFVANLPEDVDYNREILWSPFSDAVLFHTHFKLIVYAPATGRTEEIILGGDRHYRENGTFWVDYSDVKKPLELNFPTPGVFTCRFEDDPEPVMFNLSQL